MVIGQEISGLDTSSRALRRIFMWDVFPAFVISSALITSWPYRNTPSRKELRGMRSNPPMNCLLSFVEGQVFYALPG